MFFEELFHDTIKFGKKSFNGYLLIITFGVGVDDFFPCHLLLLFVALLRSHLFFFGLGVGGFIPCALPRVLLLLLLAPPLTMKHMGGGRSGLSHVMATPATSSSSEESSSSSSCSSSSSLSEESHSPT